MAIRMKVLFLLAIIAASHAQSDPATGEPDGSTPVPVDPMTETPPPQTEEIPPTGGGPIDSPPAGGEPLPEAIPIMATSEPTPDPETPEPTPDPSAQSGLSGDPSTVSAPAEPTPDECSSDYPVYAQRSFLPRPSPPEPAPPGPESCGANELFETLPLLCNPDDTTCDMYFRGDQRICIPGNICSPRCRCLPGYYRNRLGECVMPPQCCDDPNSEMVAGPNTCPGGTCDCPLFKQCDNDWVPFGCQCKTGFLKLSEDNPLCVPIQNCHLYV